MGRRPRIRVEGRYIGLTDTESAAFIQVETLDFRRRGGRHSIGAMRWVASRIDQGGTRTMADSADMPRADDFSRQVELDSVAVGPATYMVVLKPDADGELRYQVGSRQPQLMRLGEAFASKPIAVVDTLRTALLIEPETCRLAALAFHSTSRLRIFLFGDGWGETIDEAGKRVRTDDPATLMKKWGVPAEIDPDKQTLTIEFQVNIYNRESFTLATRRLFHEGPYRYGLALTFSLPSGDFDRGRVEVQSRDTGMKLNGYPLDGFPLVWPGLIEPVAAEPAAPRSSTSARSRV